MRMLKMLVGITAILALCAVPGLTQNSVSGSSDTMSAMSKSGLSAQDKKFVKEAAEGGMAEVELGQLATEKASSDDVKKFGQRMVDDHSKANDKLKELAASKGVDVPQQLNATDEAAKTRLSKLSGEAFDKAYMSMMVKDHNKDVADFRQESRSAQDKDVKEFATNTLPTLEDHLKEAKTVVSAQKQMKPSTVSMK